MTAAGTKKRENKIGITHSEKIFYFVVNLLLGIFFLLVLLPLINIVASSFSTADAVGKGKVLLWPVQPTFEGYTAVFTYKGIWRAYANTIFYTVAGTAMDMAMTLMAAYPLARRNLPLKKPVIMLFMFTMLFSGGMIPSYILMKNLGLLNTVWALLLPGLISVYNLIVCRTFMQNIPLDIEEAAKIDGCSDIRYFFAMVLPLSTTVMAVLSLYYAVGHWNDYFNPWLYLTKTKLYPLQIILRSILIQNSFDPESVTSEDDILGNKALQDLLKYSLIIVSSVPILVAYPWVKRYFMKGVMLGALKG
ncbi:MAG: carbohydrate ABC transporter permease [Clostridia bacterium]|jgi:multiple sugar transport system permease protein/putative aldouronate transport system permease protein|nr:carbohydrate ABC transporter permease [Clostridia bacterium]MBQ9407869.1 carbohydrate ABC transporter permease [Clostridia bacterium]